MACQNLWHTLKSALSTHILIFERSQINNLLMNPKTRAGKEDIMPKRGQEDIIKIQDEANEIETNN